FFVFFFFFSSRRRHTRFSRDWSSDVCSSDLRSVRIETELEAVMRVVELLDEQFPEPWPLEAEVGEVLHELIDDPLLHEFLERVKIGRASCRERVENEGVSRSVKKKKRRM